MPNAIGSYGIGKHSRSFVYPIQSELLTLINEKLNPFVEQVTIRQLDLMSQAPDGSLRSSTGRLADPSVGVVQVKPTPPPEESEPVQSGGPTQSNEPQGSAPVASEPLPSGAVEPPPASQPVDTQPPATGPAEPDPQPTQAGEPAGGDWGETPE